MFFKKKKPTEAPMGYWEKESFMILIPQDDKKDYMKGITERVEKIDGVKLLKNEFHPEKNSASLIVSYQNEEYEIGYFPTNFKVPDYYLTPSFLFDEKAIEALKKSSKAITIFMKFKDDAKTSYHLELKIATAIVPDLLALMDESSERLFSPKWVNMLASSNTPPSSKDIFSVQVVRGEDGTAWLHTHGLCRCGAFELEILDSDEKNYNNHYNLICTYGMFLIDKKKDIDPLKSVYIGRLINNTPVVVTSKPWIEGLEYYKNIDLGGYKDREKGHNSNTRIIFLYTSEEDEKNDKVSKVSIYNDLWGENPIFFLSDEETARMKSLAIEKFNYVKNAFKNKDNEIEIKIGLLVDTKDTLEHIWFRLQEIKGDKFKAKLLQEPYNIKSMHQGDEAWYKIEDITDWIIYTEYFAVTPSNSFLLDK